MLMARRLLSTCLDWRCRRYGSSGILSRVTGPSASFQVSIVTLVDLEISMGVFYTDTFAPGDVETTTISVNSTTPVVPTGFPPALNIMQDSSILRQVMLSLHGVIQSGLQLVAL